MIFAQTKDSLCTNDKQIWQAIQKELEDIGIMVAAFNANKDFIFHWFVDAISGGAFKEQSWGGSAAAQPEDSSEVLDGNLIHS